MLARRLQLLGDPEKANVPVARLLAEEYVRSLAARIERTVKDGRPLLLQADSRKQSGTVHLNSADRHEHCRADVDSWEHLWRVRNRGRVGATLGHGMSGFDPRQTPQFARSSQTTARQHVPDDRASATARRCCARRTGGRKIPNALLVVLTQYVGLGASAFRCRRSATPATPQGNLDLTLERGWPESEAERLKAIGYTVNSGNSAIVHAISLMRRRGV